MRRLDIIKIILFIGMICLTQNSLAGGFPEQLESKHFLKVIDWTDAEVIQKLSDSWANYKGKQGGKSKGGFKGRLILKVETLKIDGLNFNASTRKNIETGNYEVVFVSGAGDYDASDSNLDYCKRNIKKYTSIFGDPVNIVDLSDQASSELGIINISAQWDIKNTRIIVSCYAIKTYKRFFPLISMVYSYKNDLKPILDAVHLRCTRKSKGIGQFYDGKITEEPPFTLIIDQNRNRVSSKDIRVGETVDYGDKKIIASFVDDKNNTKGTFSLDRYTGSYIQVLKSSKNNLHSGTGIKLWGNCKRFSFDKKF